MAVAIANRGRENPAPTVNLMTSQSAEAYREMRKIIEQGKPIDIDTRDRLLFTAIIDIYEKMDPMLTFYKIGIWFASGIGVSIIALIGGILTGRVELVIK